MEQDQEKKQHVCKLCNKSFLSGRILGGHMRTHRAKNSAKEDVNLVNSDLGNESCYVQRENPKNSLKSSILNEDKESVFSAEEGVTCRICGKKFESPKSLHGHMRHHSAEERNAVRCKECGKGFKTVRSLTGHMRLHSLKNKVSRTSSGPKSVVITLSDPKTVKLVRRKRSNRIRCKVTDPNSCFPSFNEFAHGFETEQEVEEAALSLMMLSRGARKSERFESLCKSLDDDSSSFEAKSFCNEVDIPSGESELDAVDDDVLVKKKKAKVEKFDSLASDSRNKSFEFSDYACDMVCIEEKKIELQLPIASVHKAVDSNKPEVKDDCGLTFCNTQMEKGIHDKFDSITTESDRSQDCKEEVGLVLSGLEHVKISPTNKSLVVACDGEMGKDSCTEIISPTSDLGKKSQFQCRICNKLFSTHHALGGHQTLHRTIKYPSASECIQTNILPEKVDVTNEISRLDGILMEEEENGMTIPTYHSKKSKNHQCPVCAKYFTTGKALGGHKRAHIAKAREEQNMTMQQDVDDICDGLDLNLPAMVDTEDGNESEFKPWWAATSYKHEPLLNVVATS